MSHGIHLGLLANGLYEVNTGLSGKYESKYPNSTAIFYVDCENYNTTHLKLTLELAQICKQRLDLGTNYFEGDKCKIIQTINNAVAKYKIPPQPARTFIEHKASELVKSDKPVVYYETVDAVKNEQLIFQRHLNGSEVFQVAQKYDQEIKESNVLISNKKQYKPKKKDIVYFTLSDKIDQFCSDKVVVECIPPHVPRCMCYNIVIDELEFKDQQATTRTVSLIYEEIVVYAKKFGFSGKLDFKLRHMRGTTMYAMMFKNMGFADVKSQHKFDKFLSTSAIIAMFIQSGVLLISNSDYNYVPLLCKIIDEPNVVHPLTDSLTTDCFIDGCQLYKC